MRWTYDQIRINREEWPKYWWIHIHEKKIHGNYLDISENIWWYVIDPINEKNNG